MPKSPSKVKVINTQSKNYYINYIMDLEGALLDSESALLHCLYIP